MPKRLSFFIAFSLMPVISIANIFEKTEPVYGWFSSGPVLSATYQEAAEQVCRTAGGVGEYDPEVAPPRTATGVAFNCKKYFGGYGVLWQGTSYTASCPKGFSIV